MLTVVNEGAYSLAERQTGESSRLTREKSETDPDQQTSVRSEKSDENIHARLTLRSGEHVKDDLDKAYTLFQRPRKRRANLETAQRILLKAELELIHLDSSLRRRMYWGLMTVEKELSRYSGFETAEKTEHINQAQKYIVEVEKTVPSSDASLRAQVSLELHIIKGINKGNIGLRSGSRYERTEETEVGG